MELWWCMVQSRRYVCDVYCDRTPIQHTQWNTVAVTATATKQPNVYTQQHTIHFPYDIHIHDTSATFNKMFESSVCVFSVIEYLLNDTKVFRFDVLYDRTLNDAQWFRDLNLGNNQLFFLSGIVFLVNHIFFFYYYCSFGGTNFMFTGHRHARVFILFFMIFWDSGFSKWSDNKLRGLMLLFFLHLTPTKSEF